MRYAGKVFVYTDRCLEHAGQMEADVQVDFRQTYEYAGKGGIWITCKQIRLIYFFNLLIYLGLAFGTDFVGSVLVLCYSTFPLITFIPVQSFKCQQSMISLKMNDFPVRQPCQQADAAQ